MLVQLNQFAREHGLQLYLVGGFLRDALSGMVSNDVDIVGCAGALAIAAEYAKENKLCMQTVQRHGLVRVQLGSFRLDFTEYKGDGLRDDLAQRDYSVNAMALPLQKYLAGGDWQSHLIDPYQGVLDFEKKKLRAIPGALHKDPLRILRGARFAMRYGLVPVHTTLQAAKESASRLSAVAGERIVAELLAAMVGSSAGYLPLLDILGATEPIFGKRFEIKHDFITSQTDHLLCSKVLPLALRRKVESHLLRRVSMLTCGRDICKLAALLCDVDGIVAGITPETLAQMKKLPFPGAVSHGLTTVAGAINWLSLHGFHASKKERFHYYDQFREYAVEAALVYRSIKGPEANYDTLASLNEYFSQNPLVYPQSYLYGHETAALVGGHRLPGHRIGELRDLLTYAAALGDVKNRKEAHAFCLGYIHSLI